MYLDRAAERTGAVLRRCHEAAALIGRPERLPRHVPGADRRRMAAATSTVKPSIAIA